MFAYEISGCGFGSCCSHLNFRYHACYKQGVPRHSEKESFFFQIRKKSIGCSLEALNANKPLQILHFLSLYNTKASCKIVMSCVYRCIKIKMLKTNIVRVLYGFMLKTRELILVHYRVHGTKERLQSF